MQACQLLLPWVSLNWPSPAGLADGLALAGERYRWITIGFAPTTWGSPLPGAAVRGFGTRSNTKPIMELRTWKEDGGCDDAEKDPRGLTWPPRERRSKPRG